LIEHWNGTSWAIVNSPNATSLDNFIEDSYLNGVTCASASDCWAVGYDFSSPNEGFQPLIEHSNGTLWSIVAAPNTGAGALLDSVTCPSTSDCWAVGHYDASYATVPHPNQTFIEHWNGVTWVIVPSPNTSVTLNNYLTSVTCTSATNCWAVGYYYTGS